MLRPFPRCFGKLSGGSGVLGANNPNTLFALQVILDGENTKNDKLVNRTCQINRI